MECHIEIVQNVLLARLSGEFVFSDHNKFKPILDAGQDEAIKSVRIDLANVGFIDSAGLGMLLLLRDACDKHGKRLTLVGPTGQVKKVFDVSKFQHLFTIEA
ncbi:MAG: STAS domain-containing protein [Alphaproteobacteria bacterium]|nr:STAS domain-containing protein [Alphaproteobacteria bacterium]